IMTTNIGSDRIVGGSSMADVLRPRADKKASYDEMKKLVDEALEQRFRPEFLNRVDDRIVFQKLDQDDLKRIIDIELDKVRKRLKEKGLTLILTEEAKLVLIDKG